MTETTKGLRAVRPHAHRAHRRAGDERYVLPEIARYRPASEALRFSYTSVDEAGDSAC